MKTSHDRDQRCWSLDVAGPDETVLRYRDVALGWGSDGILFDRLLGGDRNSEGRRASGARACP